jgi:ElaB/YqjD/DUF883 family membrane-anchored ribosome-binding protein
MHSSLRYSKCSEHDLCLHGISARTGREHFVRYHFDRHHPATYGPHLDRIIYKIVGETFANATMVNLEASIMNQHSLRDNWHDIKDSLRRKWDSITNEDLDSFSGNVQQLVDTIQRKTGEAREGIEQYLEQLSDSGANAFGQASATVRAGAQQAVNSIQQSSQRVAATVGKGYEDAEHLVQRRPGASLGVSFGVGVLTGILVAIFMRRR